MLDIKNITVTNDCSLEVLLEKLNETGLSVLLLVDKKGLFLRTITDGDIRRMLLSGMSLDDKITNLPKAQSVTINSQKKDDIILSIMNDKKVNQLPVLDNNHKPIGIYLRHLLKTKVQLSIPHMGENELEFVREAFDTNWIAPIGPNVDAFENELAEYVGVKYAAAVSSGTAAIHLSLIILGIKPGDRVVCSSFTFVASANPILYQGATPLFVDSEKETWNMCPLALEKAIISSIEENIKPKAIIVVHLYGQSADMFKIMEISKKYDIPIVEDSAESLGSCYHGKHTGTFGEMGIFSFNGNKIITTSGGGMVVSDNKDFIEKAKFFSTQARDPYPFYEHTHIGYNYRMSNVLAGIGRGQLQVIDERVESRRKIFDNYFNALSHIEGIEWMPEPKSDFSNRWLSCIRLNSKSKVTSHELIDALSNENIEARYLWKPMHLQPLFKDCQYFHMEDGSYSDFLFETGLCLPSASNMTEAQQDRVIKVISQFMS